MFRWEHEAAYEDLDGTLTCKVYKELRWCLPTTLWTLQYVHSIVTGATAWTVASVIPPTPSTDIHGIT